MARAELLHLTKKFLVRSLKKENAYAIMESREETIPQTGRDRNVEGPGKKTGGNKDEKICL